MKAFHFLLLCLAICTLMACTGEPSNSPANQPPNNTQPPSNPTPKTEPPVVNVEPPNNRPPAHQPATEPAKEPANVDYQTLAKDYCNCAERTIQVNKKIAAAMDSSDNATFEELLPQAEEAFNEAMDCCRKAKARQTANTLDQKKLSRSLNKNCPDLPSRLSQQMTTQIK